MTGGYEAAIAAFCAEAKGAGGKSAEAANGWASLPFFSSLAAEEIGRELDCRVAAGVEVLPAAADLFSSFRLTPLSSVKAVVLGQDPYPTPGDAHGLSFSVRPGRTIPRSLRNILHERTSDLRCAQPDHGDLSRWALSGVLLLNTCLTVEAGAAGAHRKLGWQALTDQAIAAVNAQRGAAAFLLWGADAQAKRGLIDETRHLVVASAHPSPLSARRGFFGSRPFSRVNEWLAARGESPIEW
ncbi:MAG: uracil-DNA glycosylase [Beijerinckiaceae bacterium]